MDTRNTRLQVENLEHLARPVNTQTLRIGQFSDSFPPIVNGVSAFVSEHHQELLAQYHESYVFTFGHMDNNFPGVYRTPGVPMGNSPFRVNFSLDRRAYKVANSLQIFHVHEPFVIANIAIQIARRNRRPLIFTNHTRHDAYIFNYPRVIQPSLQTHVATTMERVIRASWLSTAPSEDSARWMRSLVPDLGDRVRVMRNGIHLYKFQHVDAPMTRDAFNIPVGRTIFIYIGRITPEKNLNTFAEAFVQAVRRGADAHWVIVGDGKSRAALEAELAPVQDRVHFMGTLPRDAIPAYLAMADVFATPSLSEVNPVSVIEAMACGKPYIGLKANWWQEFLDERPAGLLTEHTTAALASAIKRLCSDRPLRLEMSEHARRISSQFDIRTVTTQWIDIYRALLERTQTKS